MKSIILFLLLLPMLVSAQYDSTKNRQTISVYGYDYKNISVSGSLIIPNDTPKLAVKDSNAIACLAGRVFSWNGYVWNSFEVEITSDPNKLDSVTYRNDTLWQWKNGDSSMVNAFSFSGSYTFSNGLNESAGTVKLGGALTTSTALWGNSFKYSYAISGTDSVVVQTDFAPSWRVDKYGTNIANNLIVGNNMFFEVNNGSTQSAGFQFFNNGTTLSTYFDDGRTVKTGLRYTSLDTTGWTNYTLVPKNYINQRLAGFSTATVLKNAGTGYDIAKQGTDSVKRLQAGFGVILDSASVANTIIAKIDTAVVSTKWFAQNNLGYDTTRSGTITQRKAVALLYPGYQYFQTDEKMGQYVWSGHNWNFLCNNYHLNYYGLTNNLQFEYAIGFSYAGTGSYVDNITYGGGPDTGSIYPQIRIETGSTTTGKAGLHQWTLAGVSLDTGTIVGVDYLLPITGLSDATNDYTIRVGLVGTVQSTYGTDGSDGCYFRYNHSTYSGNWQCVTRVGGVETVSDSGVPFANNRNTNRDFIILIVSKTVTKFYIAGNLVATNTTTGWPVNSQSQFGCSIVKAAGTSTRRISVAHPYTIQYKQY